MKIFISGHGRNSYQAGFEDDSHLVTFPERQNYCSKISAVSALKKYADTPEKKRAVEEAMRLYK